MYDNSIMNIFPEMRVWRMDNPERSLTLRPPTEDELKVFFPLDPVVTRFLPKSTQMSTLSSPEAAARGPNQTGYGCLPAGMYESNGQPIGIGYVLAPDHEYPGIGQYILNERMLGKGYGTLAIYGLSRYITETLNKPVVQATTTEVNEPSQRSLARAGFSQTAPNSFVEAAPYGDGSEISALRTWLLFRPGSFALPEGKFRDPTAAEIAVSRHRYVEMDQQLQVRFRGD
jgi:RimJ/RimL family protein N-acetyltransferase